MRRRQTDNQWVIIEDTDTQLHNHLILTEVSNYMGGGGKNAF